MRVSITVKRKTYDEIFKQYQKRVTEDLKRGKPPMRIANIYEELVEAGWAKLKGKD